MEKIIYEGMTLREIIQKAKTGELPSQRLKKNKKSKRQTIQEYLGVPATWPVKEKIKHELVIMPTQQDLAGAKKGEPMACALHNAACRVFEIPNCAVGGRSAYIPQRDSKGRMYIARMQATRATQRAIRQFDKDGTIPVAGFHFIPIAPSDHAKVRRTYMRDYKSKSPRATRKVEKVHKRYREIPRNFLIGT